MRSPSELGFCAFHQGKKVQKEEQRFHERVAAILDIMSGEETTQKTLLDSSDIAKVLTSKGPVVTCVLLKATENADATEDEKPPADSTLHVNGEGKNTQPRLILRSYMEEIKVDTTPSKSMVPKLLGGPFTFLGQYEEEGVVLMVRRLPVDLDAEELVDLKPAELKALCQERDISTEQMLEKSDLIQALKDWSGREDPPFNPHVLQPPLHNDKVRGDILILKVAETKEELDVMNDLPEQMEVPSNEEFFLDYSLEDFIKFASRTDIPEYEVKDDDHSDEEAGDESPAEETGETVGEEARVAGGYESPDEGDAEQEAPFRLGDDEDIDDEDKAAMFNLVMNEVLKQYREDNGRGPDTKTLLEIRATIAKELDVQVAQVDAEQADWSKRADGTPAKNTPKTIGFHNEDKVLEYEPHPNEHNHHNQVGFVNDGVDGDDEDEENDADYEEEPAEDNDESSCDTAEPPRKRLKTEPSPGVEMTEEEEDSKPAARPGVVSNNAPEKGGHESSVEEEHAPR